MLVHGGIMPYNCHYNQNIMGPSSGNDDELEASLSPWPPLKLGVYFESVIFETKRKA